MVELPKEEQKLIHVVQLLKLEFDYNPVTGESENQKMSVIKERKPVAKKEKPAKPLTPEQILEDYPCVFLTKTALRLNKKAAEYMDLMSESGEIKNSVIGNRIRIQVSYAVDKATKFTSPVLNIDDKENLVNSQQLRDNLSISCSGQSNNLISQYGSVFLVEKGSDSQFKLKGFDNAQSAVNAICPDMQAHTNKENEFVNENLNEPQEDYDTEEPKATTNIPDPTSPEISGIGGDEVDFDEAIAEAIASTMDLPTENDEVEI